MHSQYINKVVCTHNRLTKYDLNKWTSTSLQWVYLDSIANLICLLKSCCVQTVYLPFVRLEVAPAAVYLPIARLGCRRHQLLCTYPLWGWKRHRLQCSYLCEAAGGTSCCTYPLRGCWRNKVHAVGVAECSGGAAKYILREAKMSQRLNPKCRMCRWYQC